MRLFSVLFCLFLLFLFFFFFLFFFSFGNSSADCELVVRKVSNCLDALGMELPAGVKDDALCRNAVYFCSFFMK